MYLLCNYYNSNQQFTARFVNSPYAVSIGTLRTLHMQFPEESMPDRDGFRGDSTGLEDSVQDRTAIAPKRESRAPKPQLGVVVGLQFCQ